jgi:hypothetical protein
MGGNSLLFMVLKAPSIMQLDALIFEMRGERRRRRKNGLT